MSTRVRYPGFGAIVSIEVAGGAVAAERVAPRPGCGCTPPAWAAWSRRSSGAGGTRPSPQTVPEGLLRLSVGIEDVEDLWRDLDQALRA